MSLPVSLCLDSLLLRSQVSAMLLYRGFGDHACMVNALLTEQALQTPLPFGGCGPGWPQTHYIAEAELNPQPSCLHLWVLRVQLCTTTLWHFFLLLFWDRISLNNNPSWLLNSCLTQLDLILVILMLPLLKGWNCIMPSLDYFSRFYFGMLSVIFTAKDLLSHFGLDTKAKKSGSSSEGTVYF